MADETAVAEPSGVVEPVGTSVVEPVAAETPTETPAVETQTDPNDPFGALESAMKAELGEETPAADANVAQVADPNAIPDQFQQVLGISEFVRTPEALSQAVHAADEVWKVANGQASVANLLEGMRAGNPQGFERVVNDFAQYLEQITGRKLTDQAATPPDPNQARISRIEAEFARQQEERQAAQWNQQVNAARTKATEFITAKAKGTFAEGQEAYILQQCATKAGIPEQQMVEMLLSGKTDKLEAAYRAVQKEEVTRLQAYNANLIKKHRTLANGVPASKGAPARTPGTNEAPSRKEGESDLAYSTRLWDSGWAPR